ncbi:MAG: class I SAM-dependent methyltransferase [Pseudomonadota bacterium]|uniref:Class I SAM-dependent rRNA methyltransferase n=1 Tax=Polaromonas aquatica TaxID=332657 RepID=A0ABW1U3H6_9BURK
MKSIRLREGKDRSLLRRHPWIFDGAIAKGGGDAGETVRVESHEGRFLGWAAFSPTSKIRARVWSFDESEHIDASFFIARIKSAVEARRLFDIKSDGLRLVHGESDGLPGLVVDRYGDTLVAQFSSCGTERWKSVIVQALLAQTGLTRLYERSDASVRSLEGLPEATGWLAGGPAPTLVASRTSLPPEGADFPRGGPSENRGDTEIIITEHDWKLSLDIAEGHKTGFYLDQRDSRQKFAAYARRLQFKRVLNCYCYTGGFTVAALAGGAAHVTSIDSSGPAIERAAANVALNGFDASRTTMQDADVNASLRQFLTQGRTFDAIVLDPPKFAPTAAHAERAARAYKDINRLALSILEPGGVLFTYSCSGGISADLFHKIVASAGMDAQVDAFISERMGGAPDHPMTVTFPEGEYLKGLVLLKK